MNKPFKLSADRVELLRQLVVYSTECLPEHAEVRGNALASGDNAEDKRAEDKILKDLNDGNEWAWCTVRVSCIWLDFAGEDYLGCCSYQSQEDFETPGGYYDDMKEQAFQALIQQIEACAGSLKLLDGTV